MHPQPHTSSYYAATINDVKDFAPLQGEQSADVCVIGAGFTGISTALHLAERGYKVHPVLRSGRREAVLLRIFDAQAAPSDPRALSAIPITLVCRIEHGKRKSASQGKKDVLIPRIRRPIIIAINRHAVIPVLPPRVA